MEHLPLITCGQLSSVGCRIGNTGFLCPCHQWIAEFRHVKQRFRRIHGKELGYLAPIAEQLASPFKSHLTRDRSCLWCSHPWAALSRHILQCAPLFQLCIAVACHQQSQDGRGGGSGPGDRRQHLCSLPLLQHRPAPGHDVQSGTEETAPANSSTGKCQPASGCIHRCRKWGWGWACMDLSKAPHPCD